MSKDKQYTVEMSYVVVVGWGGGGRKVVTQTKIIYNLYIKARNDAEFRGIEIPFA